MNKTTTKSNRKYNNCGRGRQSRERSHIVRGLFSTRNRCRDSDMMMQRPTPPPSILKVKTLEYSLSLSYMSSDSNFKYYEDTLHRQQQQQHQIYEPTALHCKTMTQRPRVVSFDKVDIHYHDTITVVSDQDDEDGSTTSITVKCLDWKEVKSDLAVDVEHYEAGKTVRRFFKRNPPQTSRSWKSFRTLLF
jgi:hypothetical protein